MVTKRIVFLTMICGVLVGLLANAGSVRADTADVMCYFECGLDPAGGVPWADPDNALADNGAGVSLGRWTDDPAQGTNGRPVGLMLGFSTSISNGSGNDLMVMGNPMADWWEPGYIEVAAETTLGQTGATTNGWQDETFYMIKPGNYDVVGDPRQGPLTINYDFFNGGYQDAAWQNTGDNLYGYADVNVGGDYVDIDDAIDINGDPVTLTDIAYVRIRTVTDSSAGIFGYFSTEVMYAAAVPEPATMCLLGIGGGLALLRRRRR